MSNRLTPWAARCAEILADGEWHDGMTMIREAEKTITPGVAFRRAEAVRARTSASRNGEVLERKVPRSRQALIAMGKRSISIAGVHNRVAYRGWQIEPWPIPEGGWQTGGWKVRDVRPLRRSLQALEDEHHVSLGVLRQLIQQDPPIKHERQGRVTFVYDLAGLAQRIEAYKAEAPARRGEASRKSHAQRRTKPVTKVTLKDLQERSHLGHTSSYAVKASAPHLPWQTVGRRSYLPVDQLEAWDEAVEAWRAKGDARRSAASRRSAAARAARGQPGIGETPTFADPGLNDVFTRHANGEPGLREEVLTSMRRVFQEEDGQAGDGDD